jgi:hypothetical protein
MSLKNAETHRLVQELAALTGETQTTVVTVACPGTTTDRTLEPVRRSVLPEQRSGGLATRRSGHDDGGY